jgi:hypothetical protein
MNLSLVEYVLIWCVFPSALIAIIALASNIHEECVIERKRRETDDTLRQVVITSSSSPDLQRDHLVSQKIIVRGYDSPELFREDLWLVRIDRSRKAYAKSIPLTSVPKANATTPVVAAKLICALLAQHPGSRCDN